MSKSEKKKKFAEAVALEVPRNLFDALEQTLMKMSSGAVITNLGTRLFNMLTMAASTTFTKETAKARWPDGEEGVDAAAMQRTTEAWAEKQLDGIKEDVDAGHTDEVCQHGDWEDCLRDVTRLMMLSGCRRIVQVIEGGFPADFPTPPPEPEEKEGGGE